MEIDSIYLGAYEMFPLCQRYTQYLNVIRNENNILTFHVFDNMFCMS
jgi:hypothetical protein